MMNIFNTHRQSHRENLMVNENSSDDSVDRALRSDKRTEQRHRSGKSSFRNKDGSQMYLQVDQSGSNVSLVKDEDKHSDESNFNRSIHKKSKSEGHINPDLLPRHPEPKQSFEASRNDEGKLRIPKIIVPRPGKSGRRESIVNESNDFEVIELQKEDKQTGHVKRRQPRSNENKLKIDTSQAKSLFQEGKGNGNLLNNDDHAITTAVSPEIIKPGTITKGKFKGKPALIRSGHKKRNSSSSGSDETKQLIAKAILQDYDQGQHDVAENFPDINQREMIGEYLMLINILRIERIFFNPELDILNRFCLEYTGLCVQTETRGMFAFKIENHYSRVYTYMERRINSTSTPIHEGSVGVEVPTLITRLFLGDFRITSDGTSKLDITIPILSHSHKLSLERFKAIVENIFHKKRKYYKTIDISRHEMVHLA